MEIHKVHIYSECQILSLVSQICDTTICSNTSNSTRALMSDLNKPVSDRET